MTLIGIKCRVCKMQWLTGEPSTCRCRRPCFARQLRVLRQTLRPLRNDVRR